VQLIKGEEAFAVSSCTVFPKREVVCIMGSSAKYAYLCVVEAWVWPISLPTMIKRNPLETK
jgi:hypothetical protein